MEDSDEHLVVNARSGEVLRVRAVTRRPAAEQFCRDDLLLRRLSAAPWNKKGSGWKGVQRPAAVDGGQPGPEEPVEPAPAPVAQRGERQGGARPAQEGGASSSAAGAIPPPQPPHTVPRPTRRASSQPPGQSEDKKVTCAACDHRGEWGHVFRHSVACRKRTIEDGEQGIVDQHPREGEVPMAPSISNPPATVRRR